VIIKNYKIKSIIKIPQQTLYLYINYLFLKLIKHFVNVLSPYFPGLKHEAYSLLEDFYYLSELCNFIANYVDIDDKVYITYFITDLMASLIGFNKYSTYFRKPNIYDFDLYYDILGILEFLENVIENIDYNYNIFQEDIDILFEESQNILFVKYKDEFIKNSKNK
jgi:hypothetical protein